jgi:hypothetical protein
MHTVNYFNGKENTPPTGKDERRRFIIKKGKEDVYSGSFPGGNI